MFEMIGWISINSIICWYLTSLFIVEFGESDQTIAGPFSRKEVVVNDTYCYSPGLFDFIRLGAYTKIVHDKEGAVEQWMTNDNSLFLCPYCLGFWVSVSIIAVEYLAGIPLAYPIVDIFVVVGLANLIFTWGDA